MSERSVIHGTFNLERSYPVPVTQVFQAWADPEIKVRWFAGNPADYQMDFRPGGTERNSALHEGKKIVWESLYREIVPDERIVSTEFFEGVPEGVTEEAATTLSTVTFTEADGRTKLTLLIQAKSKAARDAIIESGMEDGLQDALDLLERVAHSSR